jgi:hypothetical protein
MSKTLHAACMAELARVTKERDALRGQLASVMQRVHQGYHTDSPVPWRECERPICWETARFVPPVPMDAFCPRCGTLSRHSKVVPAWTCPACGAIFRTAPRPPTDAGREGES